MTIEEIKEASPRIEEEVVIKETEAIESGKAIAISSYNISKKLKVQL